MSIKLSPNGGLLKQMNKKHPGVFVIVYGSALKVNIMSRGGSTVDVSESDATKGPQ